MFGIPDKTLKLKLTSPRGIMRILSDSTPLPNCHQPRHGAVNMMTLANNNTATYATFNISFSTVTFSDHQNTTWTDRVAITHKYDVRTVLKPSYPDDYT
jgi:hypothetical protein